MVNIRTGISLIKIFFVVDPIATDIAIEVSPPRMQDNSKNVVPAPLLYKPNPKSKAVKIQEASIGRPRNSLLRHNSTAIKIVQTSQK